MKAYQNLNGNSGIKSYEIGDDYIKVRFKDGGIYLYNYKSAGKRNIEKMKKLAIAGEGLNAYISRYVYEIYTTKIK